MKQTNLIFALAILICAQVLSSCTSSNFSKRKYFNFKQDQKEISRVTPGQNTPDENDKEEGKATAAENTGPVEIASNAVAADQPVIAPPLMKEPALVEKNTSAGIREGKTSLTEKILVKKLTKMADNKNKGRKPISRVDDIVLLILCLIPPLPPLAVYLKTGDIGKEFWISVILLILGVLPGIIYALYICFIR